MVNPLNIASRNQFRSQLALVACGVVVGIVFSMAVAVFQAAQREHIEQNYGYLAGCR